MGVYGYGTVDAPIPEGYLEVLIETDKGLEKKEILYPTPLTVSMTPEKDFSDNLEELLCCDNKISSLDNLSQNLKELLCSYNNIKYLNNLPKNLTLLNCSSNGQRCRKLQVS